MKKTIVPFPQVPQLARTDVAYATGSPDLRSFYQYVPELASFEQIIRDKRQREYPRNELADLLQDQYQSLPEIPSVLQNIEALRSADTFTIVTAHQPALLTGPLYFIYKALTTILVAQKAEAVVGNRYRIIPVFVLGSEDHDLEELNHATLFGKKIVWEPGGQGAVGSMPASTLAPVLDTLRQVLGDSPDAAKLFSQVERCYHGRGDFAGATQALLHELLGAFGLVVINMNHPVLKRHFIPVLKEELLRQPAHQLVGDTISRLNAAGFKTQATPREINLFYMKPGMRERITREDGVYRIVNTDLEFSETEMLAELEEHPERFSPNVVMRPLYQEYILPNLAYVGGGGELAYWLERKTLFEHYGINFPMLVRRHSILWLDKDAIKKLDKLGFDVVDLFRETDALVREFVARNAAVEVNLETEKRDMKAVFDALAAKASGVDPTLEKAVRAEEVKALAGLDQWESRLVRTEKQKHEVSVNQLRSLKEKLFPGNGLQERSENVLPFLLKYGDDFLRELLEQLEPFEPGFIVLQADPGQ